MLTPGGYHLSRGYRSEAKTGTGVKIIKTFKRNQARIDLQSALSTPILSYRVKEEGNYKTFSFPGYRTLEARGLLLYPFRTGSHRKRKFPPRQPRTKVNQDQNDSFLRLRSKLLASHLIFALKCSGPKIILPATPYPLLLFDSLPRKELASSKPQVFPEKLIRNTNRPQLDSLTPVFP